MQNQFDPRTTTGGFDPAVAVGVPRAARDAGLRSYMLKVYNYMASAVLLTGIVAMVFAGSGFAAQVMATPLRWLIILSPLAIVFAMSFGVNRMKESTLQALFWSFAVLMGLSMSTIFLVFTGVSIAQTFFAVTASFLGLSLWGYTTKKDLSGFGTFLIMGVVGLLVAMIINIFLQSTAMHLAISAIGVLLFAGLTAYDTQKIKSMYAYVAGTDMMGKTVIMGALTLYLDFINMFQFLLSFMGNRE
ncbi:Bax inhibitor-1/YccA family protein [Sphingomonas sp. NSE70-1]|uniref:Bax inhibitor-1/YccA family protein n=1 Tax=Sphingomonas caseinilyticus TaxID=2908205 RepID=A0ABT0RX77_9SPHN|nr:Bax inhibitor-1/YccA family protein [Sphingomonas caseinilyticus]MCL6699577.1 Bax inhibitor-1/YccA family protein [Sphingomonas caseinilyticus]